MLRHILLVGGLEEEDGLLQTHVKLQLCHRVLDYFQCRGIHLFREHLVGTLEGVDGVDEVDGELVDVDYAVGELDEAVAFRLPFFLVGVEVHGVSLVVHDVVSLDDGVEQEALAHFLHLLVCQVGIFFPDYLGYQGLGDGLSRGTAADGLHHQVVLQHARLQVVELFFHDEFGLGARQRFQAFYHQGAGIERTRLVAVHILHGLEMPAGGHHLLHQE